VRDGLAKFGDAYMNPLTYVHSDYNYIRYSLIGVELIDVRYRLLPQDKILEEAYDPYTLLKNAYLQRREYQVTDGKMSDKAREQQEQQQYDEEKKILEESGADESSAQPQTPPQPK
jgi:phospholipid-binding lipoprotein MlaA